MFVGIDTFGCDHARSGLGSYLLSFIAHLPQNGEHKFELFGLEEDRYTYNPGKEIPFVSPSNKLGLKNERAWHRRHANKFIAKRKYDAVIYPAIENVVPKSFKTESIAIVNFLFSKIIAGGNKKQISQVKNTLKKISHIVVASEVLKDDLIKNGVDTSKIKVVHNGIDQKIFYPAIDTLLSQDVVDIKPFAIKRPYFIYASRLAGSEKKHIELIKAFNLFKEKTHAPHRLVLAGADGPSLEQVHKAAFESPFGEDILLTGYFPYESLPKLYGCSDACIFPAVNEGVGLPVLEAMACGVPVLCSNSGSLPEMGGNVPLYFDSDNIEQISSLMEKIVTDKELRKKMVTNGIEWCSAFNWEKTVGETLSLLS